MPSNYQLPRDLQATSDDTGGMSHFVTKFRHEQGTSKLTGDLRFGWATRLRWHSHFWLCSYDPHLWATLLQEAADRRKEVVPYPPSPLCISVHSKS
jgi:hypothetical protein